MGLGVGESDAVEETIGECAGDCGGAKSNVSKCGEGGIERRWISGWEYFDTAIFALLGCSTIEIAASGAVI